MNTEKRRALISGLIIGACIGLLLILTSVAGAQSPTRAEVHSIKRGLGSTSKVFTQTEPCPYILANGEYDVFCRQRKLNFAIDELVRDNITLKAENLSFNQRIDALLLRVSALEALPSSTGVVVAPTVEGGNLIVPGNLVVGGKLCISVTGGCYPDAASQIQILGNSEANIMVVSNLNSAWWQSPTKHVGMWSLSADGGMRIIQNGFSSISTYPAYDPTEMVGGQPLRYMSSLRQFVDPNRPYSANGNDSMGRFSWLLHDVGATYDYTQNLILNFDVHSKQIQFQSMQAGWTYNFSTSETARGLQNRFLVPKQ